MAEEVKKEVLKLEHEKVQALVTNGPECADWFEHHEADSDVRISGKWIYGQQSAGGNSNANFAEESVFP